MRGKTIIACSKGSDHGCGYIIIVDRVYDRGKDAIEWQDYFTAYASEFGIDNLPPPNGPELAPPSEVRERIQFRCRSHVRASRDHSIIEYDPTGRFKTEEPEEIQEIAPPPVKTEPKKRARSESDDEPTLVEGSYSAAKKPRKAKKLPKNKKGKATTEFVQGSSRGGTVLDLTDD
ncbi:hypothetical protein VNI00_004721 [Paramarasmius palmivorus]|uniref:Uncharacterized protein n=1 Tax=Paramarasmius palmivorus TaxID=297713 RepID=A0AAW0DHZ1_9AGAR